MRRAMVAPLPTARHGALVSVAGGGAGSVVGLGSPNESTGRGFFFEEGGVIVALWAHQ
jgi:hypothetical protein